MADFKGLVGFDKFVRHNPKTDRFNIHKFHHIEFFCGDATNEARRFSWGLGMNIVAKSDMSTGNMAFASYVIQSNDLKFVFTAPLSLKNDVDSKLLPHPGFDRKAAFDFIVAHGLAVRAIGILVDDATVAYEQSVAHGGVGVLAPVTLTDAATKTTLVMSEIQLFGDSVLRFVSTKNFTGPYIPNYEPVDSVPFSYGLTRIDHIVSNVPALSTAIKYLGTATGFHEFAEFTAEDVGTVDSGLNSLVLASNNEMVLLPINEPTFGTKRKSQIQTFLEQNEGAGVQHIAVKTNDIFATMRELRKRTQLGGFDFMPKPSADYYRKHLPAKVGNDLSEEQLKEVEELGLLVDKDDQGILLQIFTRPLGDRPTIFIEIIQRIGCMEKDENGQEYQRGACGGFGKGNFSELFKSIEDYEKQIDEAVEQVRKRNQCDIVGC